MDEEQYQAAITRLEEIMDAQAGTLEGDELKRLAAQIEEWEEVNGR